MFGRKEKKMETGMGILCGGNFYKGLVWRWRMLVIDSLIGYSLSCGPQLTFSVGQMIFAERDQKVI